MLLLPLQCSRTRYRTCLSAQRNDARCGEMNVIMQKTSRSAKLCTLAADDHGHKHHSEINIQWIRERPETTDRTVVWIKYFECASNVMPMSYRTQASKSHCNKSSVDCKFIGDRARRARRPLYVQSHITNTS